jgi:hypothetical protein
MKSLKSRISDVIIDDGFTHLLRRIPGYVYRNSLRRVLPVVGNPVYNGVPVARQIVFGDRFLDPRKNWYPHDFDRERYESALVDGLRTYCREGDDVVIVGGGWGVTTVVAANQVGRKGTVTTYEGALEQVDNTRQTVSLNGVDNHCEVRHAIVSQSISLRGDGGSAEIVDPVDLPGCDVLELDCEGAESDILAEMQIRPRVILVETHGLFGSSTDTIRRTLTEQGYTITDESIAEANDVTFCEEKDIKVLCALRE